MPKVLTARGLDGLVAIHEEGADINNPLNNLSNIYFHSALQYLPLAYSRDVTVRTGGKGLHVLFSHGMDKIPMILGVRTDNGDVVGGSTIIHSTNKNFTSFSLLVDRTNVCFWALGLGSLVSWNIPVRVYVFDVGL